MHVFRISSFPPVPPWVSCTSTQLLPHSLTCSHLCLVLAPALTDHAHSADSGSSSLTSLHYKNCFPASVSFLGRSVHNWFKTWTLFWVTMVPHAKYKSHSTGKSRKITYSKISKDKNDVRIVCTLWGEAIQVNPLYCIPLQSSSDAHMFITGASVVYRGLHKHHEQSAALQFHTHQTEISGCSDFFLSGLKRQFQHFELQQLLSWIRPRTTHPWFPCFLSLFLFWWPLWDILTPSSCYRCLPLSIFFNYEVKVYSLLNISHPLIEINNVRADHCSNILTAFTKVAPASPIKAFVFFVGVCRTETRESETQSENMSQMEPGWPLKQQNRFCWHMDPLEMNQAGLLTLTDTLGACLVKICSHLHLLDQIQDCSRLFSH